MEDEFTTQPATPDPVLAHYYGDVVRGCFITSGFVLLIAILVDRDLLGFYLIVGVLAVLGIVILAGLTSPTKYWVFVLEAIVAGVGVLIFEYLAVVAYTDKPALMDPVFLLRQILSVLYLITLYYSVKNIRWAKQNQNLVITR